MPSIRIEQRTDAAGAPAPAQYRREVHATLNLPVESVAIDLLARLHAARTGTDGEYGYTDPGRGSGLLRLEGFDTRQAQTIDDHFRVEEMRVRLGLSRSSRQWVESRTYFTRPTSLRNPISMIVIAAFVLTVLVVLAVLSSVGPLRVPGETFTWYYLPPLGVAIALFAWVLVFHLRRLSEWRALRAAFRAEGGRMPVNLRTAE